ncbi:MAG: hypothetical protein HZC55_09495 [Verrucomicrobia bacterium]|nr:hypothetical protein [Verrucomicrobiota bacterium]
MPSPTPFLSTELQYIQKIIADETWLEGERRGCPVPPEDAIVQENVCNVILRVGSQMRAAALAAIGSAECDSELAS